MGRLYFTCYLSQVIGSSDQNVDILGLLFSPSQVPERTHLAHLPQKLVCLPCGGGHPLTCHRPPEIPALTSPHSCSCRYGGAWGGREGGDILPPPSLICSRPAACNRSSHVMTQVHSPGKQQHTGTLPRFAAEPFHPPVSHGPQRVPQASQSPGPAAEGVLRLYRGEGCDERRQE